VDEVTEVIRLRDSAIAPLPATTEKRYLRGIGKEEKRLLILLDVDELFSEEEMQELKEVG
ncbi:MAG: chemotaxis protein CheW, partial [Bacillota bacterium]